MNIYKSLNEITKYIDENLEEDISYETLSKFLGVNVYTLQRLFSMIAGISISEYIRKRRLSNAGFDLYEGKLKLIDIAIKYQYENATSFSRAFEKFHGIKPSLVNKKTKLKNFPRIVFNEEVKTTTELDYEIVTLPEMNLYGVGIETNNEKIGSDAPRFFKEIESKYIEKYGEIKYGMITYEGKDRKESQKYYCLYDVEIPEFEHIKIPESKWIQFKIGSQETSAIQNVSHEFYRNFQFFNKYNLKEIPELEYYHDNVTDFLVAIY